MSPICFYCIFGIMEVGWVYAVVVFIIHWLHGITCLLYRNIGIAYLALALLCTMFQFLLTQFACIKYVSLQFKIPSHCVHKEICLKCIMPILDVTQQTI